MMGLYRGVMWQVEHLPAEHWCILSLLLTVACFFVLRGFGPPYRL